MMTSSAFVNISEPRSTKQQGKFPPPIAGFSVSALNVRGAVELRSNLTPTSAMRIPWERFTAGCYAISRILAPSESFTTVELKINFLRPVWKAKLRAEARLIHAGKLVGMVECDVFDERQRLIARASSTCMKLTGANAEARALPAELGNFQKVASDRAKENSAQHN
jgi:hypothetical protein